jgi:iron(III) transport system substrate-binding protein
MLYTAPYLRLSIWIYAWLALFVAFGSIACAPAGAPVSPTGGMAARAAPDLDELARLARQEGALNIIVPPGQQYRDAIRDFQQIYPDIRLEVKGEHIRDAHPRILQERAVGIYSTDVMIGSIGAAVFQDWIPQDVLAPLAPILLPSIRDDSKWIDGFDAGWMDNAQKYVYAFLSNVSQNVWVNRDIISERDLPNLATLDILLDPRWKGKIVWDDPRELGPGVNFATLIIQIRGEDFLRRLIEEQDIVVSRDVRQIVEWVVRGRYPIGFALNTTILEGFRRQGVGHNVQVVEITEINQAVPGFGVISIFDQAPHPHAARLFVNWFLSAEGQKAYTAITAENSRRTDVPPANPEQAPVPGVKYTNLQKEEFAALRARAAQVAREALR